MQKFKAVLFDLGNTLLYFDADWPTILSQANLELFRYLKSVGLEFDEDLFQKEFRNRMNEYYKSREIDFIEITTARLLMGFMKEKGFSSVSEEIIREALKNMYRVSQEHWQIEEDCLPMLEDLKTKGYQLGILSNASDDLDVQRLVDKSQIRKYMDFSLSSAACGIRKPDPRIFSIALDFWGYKNHEVLMVGDTLNADILGAKNSNIANVWITRRANKPDIKNSGNHIIPDNTIEALSELPSLIENLSS